MSVPATLRPLLSSTLLAGMLAAAAAAPAVAGGDIVKCIDKDGGVTLTDGECRSGMSSVIVPAALNTAPGESAAVTPPAAVRRVALVAQPMPAIDHDNWIDPRPRSKVFARDAATLRAARASLQALDETAASLRVQRVASN